MDFPQFTNEGQKQPPLTFSKMHEVMDSKNDSSNLEFNSINEEDEIVMITQEMVHVEEDV